MKKLPDRRHADSMTRASHRIPQRGRCQDGAMLMALLIAGIVLICVCHYSLTQLSAFYGLLFAVQTANRGRYVD